MLQKRQPYQAINWSLVTLILAACGGGGGGGAATTFTRPQSGTAATIATESVTFIQGRDGAYSGSIGENTLSFTAEQLVSTSDATQAASRDLRIEKVDFTSPQSATVTISFQVEGGRRSVPVEFRIQGADAKQIEIVSFSADGGTTLTFASTSDYDRPRDADGNNTYEVTITARYGSITNSERYVLRVTNKDDGPTTVASEYENVPAHSRENDVIRIEVREGTTEVFLFNSDRLSAFFGNLFAGADADKFTVKRVLAGGEQKTLVEFRQAPHASAPAD